MTLAAMSRFTRQRFSAWTLRGRLLAALIGLLALMCLLVGIVTETVAHKYLVAELDTSVNRLATHAQTHQSTGDSPTGGPPGFLGSAQVGQDSVGVAVVEGNLAGRWLP